MLRLLFILLLSSFIRLDSEPLKAQVQAKSAILINADNGAILFEKKSHTPCHPASTTKIATTIYALENQSNLETPVTISKTALISVAPNLKKENPSKYPAHILENDGSNVGLKPGDIFSLSAILYGTMLVSGNDAANALAEHCAGNVQEFMLDLNKFIRNKLHLKNTYFSNPHGLHQDNHISTAYDLAKITQYALKNAKFREIVKATTCEISSSKTKETKILEAHNRLLKKGTYYYPKAIGVKTGYHSKAGHNLVAAAEHEGRCLIAVLLGYDQPDQRYKDAISLFEMAFKEPKHTRTLFSKQFDLFTASIPKADKVLNARLNEDVKVDYFPSEELHLQAKVLWNRLTFPIEKGMSVGEVVIKDEAGGFFKSFPIFAEERIEKTFFFSSMDIFRNHYFQAGILEVLLAAGCIIYFRRRKKRRLKKAIQSSNERSSGRD